MIAILNDAGESLQLSPDQNLVTEQAVAWLTDDELPAEFSYPIDVPLNEHNKKFVSYGYRPDSAQPRQTMPVTVRLEGVLYRRCVFAYKVQNGKLNGYLKIDSAEVYDALRKKTLLEALPDEIDLGTGLHTENGQPVLPSTLAERMALIAALPPGQFPLTFFPIRNETFFESDLDNTKVPGYTKQSYVNCWKLIPNLGHGFAMDTSTVSGFPVVPQLFLWWVLERIMALAGFQIESSWLASEPVQRMTIFNLTAMSQQKGPIVITNNRPTITPFASHKVTAGMHLPDMSVSDFLKAIKGRFGLLFAFNANSRTCYIEQFVSVVDRGPVIDLTPYQSGPYDSGDPNGKGFAVSEFVDSQDELFKDSKGNLIEPAPLITGKGITQVSLKVGTTQMIYETDPLFGAGKWLIPTVRQAGNLTDPLYKNSDRYLDQAGKRKNDTGLKLLTYLGMTHDSKQAPYPMATNDVRDGQQQVVGSQAMSLTGPNGLWRTCLRAFYYFRDNTIPINQPLLLPVAILSQMKLYQSVWLSLEDQIRRSYVISKMQAESPGIDGKAIVRLEVLSLPTGVDQPADVDEPLVWVELIATPAVRVRIPQGERGWNPNPNDYSWGWRDLQTFSVQLWADRAKTTPVIVGNLTINIRLKRLNVHHVFSNTRYDTYDESVRFYTVVGQTLIIEKDFVSGDILFGTDSDDPNDPGNAHFTTLQLDPGQGYSIIS